MTSTEIRTLSTPALRQVVSGLTGADRTSRLIAQGEIDRRKRAA